MKNCFFALVLLVNSGFVFSETNSKDEVVEIVVHRSPTCGCCGKWVDHLKQNNFKVQEVITEDVQAVKDNYGVTKEMASCHTAIVDGYVVEGHVPASDIRTMLKNKPEITGIAVPGMPKGTPGMEMDGAKDAYQVLSFNKKNQYQVFNNYKAE